MEAVILCGLQATGKSTLCRERFFRTHVRINLDMLKSRHREAILVRACLEAKQPFVVDNTNPTREDRKKYVETARAAGFKVVCYYFESRVAESLIRNESRPDDEQVPSPGIKATAARLELPSRAEGFDEMYYVRIGTGSMEVQEWRDEV